MDNEMLKQTKNHFSKLGLMYFLGTLIILACQLLTSLAANSLAPDLMADNNLSLIIVMLPMYMIAMPLMGLLIKMLPASRIEQHKMTIGQWMIAFLICYAILYISNIAGQIISTIIGFLKGSMVSNAIVEIASGISPWVSIFIMVLLAPIAEELLFRKLLIDRTVKYGEGIAILLSGLMFGLFHGNLNQFAYAFTLGLFLGFIYVRTGNVIYSILLHMSINFMGSVVAMLVLNVSGYEEIAALMGNPEEMMAVAMEKLPQLMILFIYFILLIGITISGIVLLIINKKRFICRPGELSIPKGKRFSTIFLNIGMILFSLYWIIQIILQLFQ